MAAGEAFSRDQRLRVAAAIGAARQQTGMRFAVYVGPIDGDPQRFAERRLADIPGPEETVLVVVGPAERVVQIVTTPAARRRLSDQACALAVLSMTTSFGLGDLVGGISVGLRMLADATAPHRAPEPRPEAGAQPAAAADRPGS